MKPLEGVKVIEFATHVAVPAAGRLLADWGAEVIKIESAAGDAWRGHGGFYNLPAEPDCNPVYSVTNSGKKLLSLNLKHPEGKAVLLKMLKETDIFITNIRWAAIQRLGLDYETMHEMFPKIVYFHFNGFGYEGPDKDRPGFDQTAFWSMSGALHEMRDADGHPAAPPGGFGDTVASGFVLSGILAALYQRDRTGEGMRVTSSLYGSGIWCNYSRIVICQERSDGSVPPVFPSRARDGRNPLANVYQCQDGEWILIAVNHKNKFREFMPAIGLEAYVDDERFTPVENMRENAQAFYDLLAATFLTKPAEEWANILATIDTSYQVLIHSGDISKADQAWANDYVTRMMCPNGNDYVVPNSPITFFGVDRVPTCHVGGTGSNTVQVLAEHGYSEDEIKNLLECGAAISLDKG